MLALSSTKIVRRVKGRAQHISSVDWTHSLEGGPAALLLLLDAAGDAILRRLPDFDAVVLPSDAASSLIPAPPPSPLSPPLPSTAFFLLRAAAADDDDADLCCSRFSLCRALCSRSLSAASSCRRWASARTRGSSRRRSEPSVQRSHRAFQPW